MPAGKLLMRRIPSSGETIPAIGLGTSGPFEVGADEAARAPLREVLQGFFAGGATLIDTSPMYSTAEAVLGDLLTPEQQAKVFIATKVWTPGSGGHGEQKGIEQMQRSMALLKHKRIELMQVHNLVDLDAHLKTLRRWKAEGQDQVHRRHALHHELLSRPHRHHRAREARLRAVQLFGGDARGREAPAAAVRRQRRRGAHQSRVRGRQPVHAVQGKPLPPGRRSSARRAGRRCS